MNIELFIELVRENPILYNVSHEKYKENNIKNNVWDSIVLQVEQLENG